MLATSERTAYAISLSGGEAHDGPEGENLLVAVGERPILTDLAMDKAYSGVNIRIISETLNFNPIVPPKSNSKEPWDYDKEKYKQRNKIERLFERIKRRFRKVFTRYDKLDVIYLAFVYFALIVEYLKFSVNTP